ncbi:uncharacterized protein LOC127698770 [Mytilus californianus]|uniref:uncharacterized protein LOC127698770 n=1 Tax=Mytilus californianus TaxID=6549 RepID=UPI00224515F1|nr:uncharacterized protein LOC127698770 [Mytilus californianus]XP_052058405.1 uncharacterized protein LOC127698770 [Mytilus californianus]
MKSLILVLLMLHMTNQIKYDYETCDNCASVLCVVMKICFCDGDWDICNVYIFKDEVLNMTCTLRDKGINSSDLYVTYGKGTEVSKNEMVVINNSSLRLTKHMNSMEQVGHSKFVCMNGNKTIVDTTDVTVDYPPSPIENFSCIIYNWDKGMNCTWDLGVKYYNKLTITVSLLMKSGDITRQYNPACDRDKNENIVCNYTWNQTDHVTFDRSFLNFTVNVTNTCCTKVPVAKQTENLIIIQKENVKPDKVHNVTVASVKSTCVSLNWDHRKQNRSKLFTVRATTNGSYWDDAQQEETQDTSLTVCDLKPYTRYNFSIETRPGKDVGYPGDPVYISANTDMDKPSRPPEFVNSGYQVMDEDCINNARRITVLWKAIAEEYQNGPFLGYYISASSPNDGLFKEYHANSSGSDHQQQPMDILCDQPITITMKSWGKAGYSNTSTIVIPKANYLSQLEVAGIVIGVILFVVMVIILAVCVFRIDCCGKIKEFFKPPEIELPVVKINYMEHNKDSGHETFSTSTFKSTHTNGISEKESQYSAVYSNAGYSSVGSQNEDHFVHKGSSKDGRSQSIGESFSDINSGEDSPQSSGCSYESYSSSRMLLNSEEDDDGYRGAEESTYYEDDSVKSYVQQDGKNSSELTSSNTTETSNKQCSTTKELTSSNTTETSNKQCSTTKDSQQDSTQTTHQTDSVKTAIKTKHSSQEAGSIKSTGTEECV